MKKERKFNLFKCILGFLSYIIACLIIMPDWEDESDRELVLKTFPMVKHIMGEKINNE